MSMGSMFVVCIEKDSEHPGLVSEDTRDDSEERDEAKFINRCLCVSTSRHERLCAVRSEEAFEESKCGKRYLCRPGSASSRISNR